MDQSFHVKPFRFNTEFAATPFPEDGPITEGSLAMAALRAEMEALRADHAIMLAKVRAEAELEGLARARSERDQAVLEASMMLHAQWEAFEETRDAIIEQLRSEACTLARAIGETLAARALEEAPAEAIDAAIGRMLSQIARGQEVLINVHPDLVSEIEARIANRQTYDRRKLNLVVQADDTLPPGDAHLRWNGGGLMLDAEERAQAIRAELEALGASGETPAD